MCHWIELKRLPGTCERVSSNLKHKRPLALDVAKASTESKPEVTNRGGGENQSFFDLRT